MIVLYLSTNEIQAGDQGAIISILTINALFAPKVKKKKVFSFQCGEHQS